MNASKSPSPKKPKARTRPPSHAIKKEFPNPAQRARLKLAMVEANLNQTQLGELAKVDQEGISRWLKGERDMAALALLRVAKALRVSAHWLLAGDEPERRRSGGYVLVEPVAAGDPEVQSLARDRAADPPEAPNDGGDPPRRRSRS